MKHHIVGDAIEEGIIYVEHIHSEQQHADIVLEEFDVNTSETYARILINSPRDRI